MTRSIWFYFELLTSPYCLLSLRRNNVTEFFSSHYPRHTVIGFTNWFEFTLSHQDWMKRSINTRRRAIHFYRNERKKTDKLILDISSFVWSSWRTNICSISFSLPFNIKDKSTTLGYIQSNECCRPFHKSVYVFSKFSINSAFHFGRQTTSAVTQLQAKRNFVCENMLLATSAGENTYIY